MAVHVCHRASSENLSVGTILRKIVEEHRQHDGAVRRTIN